MPKPFYQKVITWIAFLGAGFLALATLLDAVNNALSLVTPIFTIIGSVVILISWILVELVLRKKPIDWIANGGTRVKITKLNTRSRLFVIGSVALLWVPMFFAEGSNTSTHQQPTPNPIPPAEEDEFLVLLAEFRNDSRVTYDIAGSIQLAVDEGLKRCPNLSLPKVKIRLERSNQSFARNEVELVRRFGQNYNATMVIWGYYDDAGIFPFFTVVPTNTVNIFSNVDPMTVVHPDSPKPNLDNLANPTKNLGFYVHEEVPEIMTFLAESTIGQMFFLRGDACAATAYLDAAIEQSKKVDVDQIRDSLKWTYALHSYISYMITIIEPTKRNYEIAIDSLTGAISLDPQPGYYYTRALVHEDFGSHEEAIADFSEYIRMEEEQTPNSIPFFSLAPDLIRAHLLRGKLYIIVGRPSDALPDLDKAIELGMEDLEVHLLKGFAYQDMGDTTSAIQAFSYVISKAPDDEEFVDAYSSRGLIYYYQGELDAALADFNKALSLSPDTAEIYYNRALVYLYLSDCDKAVIDLDKSIELNPKHARSYYTKGLCFSKNEQLDEAIALYSKAIENDPNVAVYYYDRAVDYFLTDQVDLGISDATKAIELDSQLSRAYLLRGEGYRIKGEKEKAIRDFRKAYELSDDPVLRQNIERMLADLE